MIRAVASIRGLICGGMLLDTMTRPTSCSSIFSTRPTCTQVIETGEPRISPEEFCNCSLTIGRLTMLSPLGQIVSIAKIAMAMITRVPTIASRP